MRPKERRKPTKITDPTRTKRVKITRTRSTTLQELKNLSQKKKITDMASNVREARRRKIMERGSDRLALITGQIQSLPSSSSHEEIKTDSDNPSSQPLISHTAAGTLSLSLSPNLNRWDYFTLHECFRFRNMNLGFMIKFHCTIYVTCKDSFLFIY